VLCPQGQDSRFSRYRSPDSEVRAKKVTAIMVTLECGKTPKVTVPNGTFPIPVPRLEVKHPSAETQENKGLVPLTLRTGKIMWIYPDLVKMNNGTRRDPSQRANLVMLSPSCQMMVISQQLLSAILKGESTLARHRLMYLSRQVLDLENHT